MSGFKASTLSGSSSDDESVKKHGKRKLSKKSSRNERYQKVFVSSKTNEHPYTQNSKAPAAAAAQDGDSSPEMCRPSFYSSPQKNASKRSRQDKGANNLPPVKFESQKFYAASSSRVAEDDNSSPDNFYNRDVNENVHEGFIGFKGAGNRNSSDGAAKPHSRKRPRSPVSDDASEKSDDGNGNDDGNNNDAADNDSGSPTMQRPRFTGRIKTQSTQQPHYDLKAQKMMMKWGFKEGSGLGKHSQGRVDIVETSTQRGRRGLGLHLEGLEPSADIDWEKEEIAVAELIEWMPECKDDPPEMSELRPWMKEGPKKLTIDDEAEFCSEVVLKKVLNCKNIFDNLEQEEMRKARTRSNPFETIRGVMFQNRAAMKMANMDAIFDFMFTKPMTEDGKPVLGQNDLLYFADICAGPGGFSEYVLFRKKWEAKGFGFTLKGANDFKLEEFHAAPTETFETHYGVSGSEGDGNIYIPENLREFRRFVLESTENKGVHFVMADGGFSVEGEENLQEILSKQLYTCQFLCALSIIRPGGHFVCKVFDLFTPFSVGLVYLLYRAFRRICIVKPNTSRPANSERYIVGQWLREGIKDIHDYLFEVNCRLEQLKSVLQTDDIMEIVPLHILKDDIKFYNYIVRSNELLGEQQAMHLTKIQAYCQNTDLYEERQSDLRKKCLELWQIPDRARCAPQRPEPMAKFKELVKNEDPAFLDYGADPLDLKKLDTLKSVYDYRCLVLGSQNPNKIERGFFLGLGRTKVYQWDPTRRDKWRKVDLSLEIPNDTLVYAEIVQELLGEGRGQRKMNSLHIIDALYLGGKEILNKHYTERIMEAQKFVKAIYKPTCPMHAPVRVKDIYRFQEMSVIFDKLKEKIVKDRGGMRHRLCYCGGDEERYFVPHGVLIVKTVNEPWTVAFSRSRNSKYFFNQKTRESRYDAPKEGIATFRECFHRRLLWTWEQGVRVHDSHQDAQEGKVHREIMIDKIEKLLHK